MIISPLILFLDFDGVINNMNYLRYGDQEENPDGLTTDQSQIDPKKIKILNHIISVTKCDVVISSAWRLTDKLSYLRELLKSRGLVGRVVSKTPSLPSEPRGKEIQLWLDKTFHNGIIIEKFAILEDEEDMVHLEPYTVRTSFEEGLTDYHANRVIKLLS